MGRLAAGDASLSDTTLTISGRAADPQSYAAFVEALKALPKGLTLGSANIIPPNVTPYVWSIEKGAGGVAIGGYAPDRQTRDANAAAARGVFAGVSLQGATLRQDIDVNTDLYGKAYENAQIVKSGLGVPEAGKKMISLLSKYSARKSK